MWGDLLAVLAAAMNATASVLQRQATRDEPDDREFSIGLLWDLVRRPAWLGGIAAILVGFLFQATALTLGRIATVQPLLVLELPLTLLLAMQVFGTRLRPREWWAIGAMAAGLAAFVFCASPTGGDPLQVPRSLAAVAGGATVGGIVLLVLVSLRLRAQLRAAVLGVATGAAFGFVAMVVSVVGAVYTARGLHGLVTSWSTYAVVVAGPLSFFLLQNALQAGNLVASQPGFTLVNPLVSVIGGVLVFGETIRGGPWLLGTALGAAVIVAGTVLLVRAPALTGSPGEADRAAEDGPGEDGPGEDASGEDRSGEDASGEDASGEDASGEDASGEDGSGKGVHSALRSRGGGTSRR